MVGRQVSFTAQAGRGDELVGILLEVARSLSGASGCRLYMVSRDAAAQDAVWVTELWQTDADAEAALAAQDRRQIGRVMALLDGPPQRTDLEPLGGVGVD